MQSFPRRLQMFFGFAVCSLLWSSVSSAQQERNGIKLAVIIVVDNFRYDYLTRFDKCFSDSGFRWLKKTGTLCTNALFDDAVAVTAKGHATISTGCYGGKSGIVNNHWYSRDKKKSVYAAEDTSVSFITGGGISKLGQRSPAYLIPSTVGEELHHASPHSRIMSVSIKDRSAILLAGKRADAAYWFDDRTGEFVSSTYYMKSYPLWCTAFNGEKRADAYFNATWTKLLPDNMYAGGDADDVPYETDSHGLGRAFPHPVNGGLTAPDQMYYRALCTTPFGTDLLLDFAQQLIIGEQLGSRDCTDLLGISISSTDLIGHAYGPDSHETRDAFARMDRSLAGFFQFLETTIGLNNCLLVVTSDHGTGSIPEFLTRQNRDAGRIHPSNLISHIEEELTARFGATPGNQPWVEAVHLPWVYIRRSNLTAKNISLPEFDEPFRRAALSVKGIAGVLSRQELESPAIQSGLHRSVGRSYNRERSGDYFFAVKPNYIFDSGSTGAEHGTGYEYDTHVPIFIRGAAVTKGTIATRVGLADLAPTLAKVLQLTLPGERDGKPLPVKIAFAKTAQKPKKK